ncbi:hypothetical protein D3C85_1510170 [compost metagenome]
MAYIKFNVTLKFGGEDCPLLPAKSFLVDAVNAEVAVRVATNDAVAKGYKRGWVVEHEVEVL